VLELLYSTKIGLPALSALGENRGGRPRRPAPWEEQAGLRLLLALAPRLRRKGGGGPPPAFAPFEELSIERSRGRRLWATFYPVSGPARGAVLLLHPWIGLGQGYFHRLGRLEALRAAGYEALTLDLPGFGASSPPAGFYDRDIHAALEWLGERRGGSPLHLWGVSSGGYWAHLATSGGAVVDGAVFEDVTAHLLEWSYRTAPRGRPFYAFFRRLLPRAHRFLDLRRHARHLGSRATAYVGGGRDEGAPAEETRALAELAGGDCLIVPEAIHLGAIKRAKDEVIGLALETFSRAEALEGGLARRRRAG